MSVVPKIRSHDLEDLGLLSIVPGVELLLSPDALEGLNMVKLGLTGSAC